MSKINMTAEEVDSLILKKLDNHSLGIILDKEFFLDLLKHSLSLNVSEKQNVIDRIPTLSQYQFDELIKVFLEERDKFRELMKEHPDDIKKLLENQRKDWIALGELYKISEESTKKAKEDEAKINDIKSQFGL